MRRLIPALAVVTTVGCGSEHGKDGTVVREGHGIQGVPGGGTGVTASRAVPVSGGTMIVARDGVTAVAADPDRDKVFVVDINNSQGVREVTLQPGDEPGRVAEDGARRAHVALRRGGALVSIDLASGKVVDRRSVCPSPRGVAWDSATDLVHVACQTGELVSLPAAGGEVVQRLRLGRDLRDVVVKGDRLYVSRLKSATVVVVTSSGSVENELNLPPPMDPRFGQVDPAVAWRMVALPTGALLLAHQHASPAPVVIDQPSSYGSPGGGGGGGGCVGGIVGGRLSSPMDPAVGGSFSSLPLPNVVGPTDMAVSANGDVAIVSIGNAWGAANTPVPGDTHGVEPVPTMPFQSLATVRFMARDVVPTPQNTVDPCSPPGLEIFGVTGEPTSIAFASGNRFVVLSREPAQLQIFSVATRLPTGTIRLTEDSRADTGLALFHMNSGLGLACASCHPEGLEDGRVWEFAELGRRRTQMIAGGVLATAPLHWSGDMEDFSMLVHEVFEARMGAGRPNRRQITHFEQFIDNIPPPPFANVDGAAAERGRALFESPALGCASCHAGGHFTDNKAYDVGSGGEFQVPSLIGVGSRAPFLHNGCASTLEERFGKCGSDRHGMTSQLAPEQIGDLVSYLESL